MTFNPADHALAKVPRAQKANLTETHERVLQVMGGRRVTMPDLEVETNMPRNTLSSILSELYHHKLIDRSKQRMCKLVEYWRTDNERP